MQWLLYTKFLNGGEQFLLRLRLPTGNVEAGLQSTDADVDVGGLCRHGQSRRRGAGFRSLILGERGFAL